MGRIFHPLLFLLARCAKNELIRQIEFLKAENALLRARVPKKRIHLTRSEKTRLVKLGKAIGPGLKHVITIVAYTTYLRWVRATKRKRVPQKVGRPRTEQSIRDLIVRIASETGWGYTRVMGELKKLGLTPPSRSTVKRILKEHKLNPTAPDGQGTWAEFLRIHAETLWQCDFFSKRIWTPSGLRQCFVLVFLNVGSRKVFVSPCCRRPTPAWMKEQAEAFVRHVGPEALPGTIVTRDRDSNYGASFDGTLTAAGAKVKKASFRSPNLQAYVERFIQSLQHECLDHFIVCGERHFNHLISEYVEHYLTERPHQAKGNLLLTGAAREEENPPNGRLVCRQRLGGVLKSYHRRAA